MQISGKFSRSSLDSCEPDSDSKESWDDRLNSPKNWYFDIFLRFFEDRFDRLDRFDIPFYLIDAASEGVVDRPVDIDVDVDIIVDAKSIITSFGLTIVIGVIGALSPISGALRMQPAQALRYEGGERDEG